MPPDEIRPRLVADGLDQVSRPHDVGEPACAGSRPRHLRLGRVSRWTVTAEAVVLRRRGSEYCHLTRFGAWL